MYIDHSHLKYFVIMKLGCLNVDPDHLSRIESSDETTSLEEGLSNA